MVSSLFLNYWNNGLVAQREMFNPAGVVCWKILIAFVSYEYPSGRIVESTMEVEELEV